MNKATSRLLSILSFAIILSAMIYGLLWLRHSKRFSINLIQIHAQYLYITPQQIKRAMLPYLSNSNFFSLPIDSIERALANLPAIANVRLKRQWPHTLIVHIKERQPIAVWNGNKLLDQSGAIFSAPKMPSWALLPHFTGQKDQAKNMITHYQQMRTALSQDNLVIKACTLSAIGDWQLQLIPGNFWVYLGNRFLKQRLTRLIGSYQPLLASNPNHKIAYIDLRYPQGMAVRWISS